MCHFLRHASGPVLVALVTVIGVLIVIPGSFITSYAGASTVPTCTANQLLLIVAFNGPGNPSGAMIIQGRTTQTCELSGQPRMDVFSASNRELRLPESMFEFTPKLAPPASPIVISPSHLWAVVELRWCGFPSSYSRVGLRFPGWTHSLSIPESTIKFEPPACRQSGASQLAVDVIRRFSASGIVGRPSHVTVTPASNLRNGEKVRVTVSGYGLGAKFFVSECADAKDVSPGGCGGQLALQNFGLTNMMGSGSYVVTVKNVAATGLSPKGPFRTCLNNCVLTATGGEGGANSYVPLRFG
jgi:hypothetical protein